MFNLYFEKQDKIGGRLVFRQQCFTNILELEVINKYQR